MIRSAIRRSSTRLAEGLAGEASMRGDREHFSTLPAARRRAVGATPRGGTGARRPPSSALRRGVVCLLLLLAAGCEESTHAQAPPPPPSVTVQAAVLKGVSRSAGFVGRTKAVDIVQLRARVEGFLEKVAFKEGDEVKPGQLLYQIETVQYQAQLDQAKANLAAARAQELNAQLQYDRASELVKRQNISQATVDQDKANLDAAKASRLQNEAAVTLAQVNLGYTEIKAPIAGRIGRTAFTQGNLVNPSS